MITARHARADLMSANRSELRTVRALDGRLGHRLICLMTMIDGGLYGENAQRKAVRSLEDTQKTLFDASLMSSY